MNGLTPDVLAYVWTELLSSDRQRLAGNIELQAYAPRTHSRPLLVCVCTSVHRTYRDLHASASYAQHSHPVVFVFLCHCGSCGWTPQNSSTGSLRVVRRLSQHTPEVAGSGAFRRPNKVPGKNVCSHMRCTFTPHRCAGSVTTVSMGIQPPGEVVGRASTGYLISWTCANSLCGDTDVELPKSVEGVDTFPVGGMEFLVNQAMPVESITPSLPWRATIHIRRRCLSHGECHAIVRAPIERPSTYFAMPCPSSALRGVETLYICLEVAGRLRFFRKFFQKPTVRTRHVLQHFGLHTSQLL